MSAANVRCASLRHTEVLDLTFLNQLLHRACNVFDWHIRIDAVLIEQIDYVGVEAFQGGFSYGPDSFRVAVGTLAWNSILKPNFVAITTWSRTGEGPPRRVLHS